MLLNRSTRAIHIQGASYSLAQHQTTGAVGQGDVITARADRANEVVTGVGERDVARARVQSARARHRQGTRLRDVTVSAGAAQVAAHRGGAKYRT